MDLRVPCSPGHLKLYLNMSWLFLFTFLFILSAIHINDMILYIYTIQKVQRMIVILKLCKYSPAEIVMESP